MPFLKKVWYITWKDIRSEFRTKETMTSMLIFALLVLVIFSFAFNPTPTETKRIFPGIIWVGFFFAGVLGLNRSFARERENDCLAGLMLAPVDRSAIYFGKVLGNSLFMLVVELVTLPVFIVFFDYSVRGSLVALGLIFLLGTFGFVAVGTFLSALATNTRTSEILLPIILFPIIIPVVIAVVQATASIFAGASWSAATLLWVKVLVAYDVIFLVVPFLLFEYLLEV